MVKVKTGIDLLVINRFVNSYKKRGKAFSERIFSPQELSQNSSEQLASIFCLKEALIKALGLPKDSWLLISTNRKRNGKVECSFADSRIVRNIKSIDTSISHDGGMVVAVATALLSK